jgi:Arc/MetJ-type ribon-helix-helix transcriptional regulator
MSKQKVTCTLPEDLVSRLEDRVSDDPYDPSNRSEAIREALEHGLEYDSLVAERDDLRRQLSASNARFENHEELVEYVKEERFLRKRQAEAPIWRRAKWWVFGQ